MVWVPPTTVAVNDTFAATRWNDQVKGNLEHVRQTHGPIWIPPPAFQLNTATMTLRDTDPEQFPVINLADVAFPNAAHTTLIVPDDWISGGFTIKVHWAPTSTVAGGFRIEVRYGFVNSGSLWSAARTVLGATLTSPVVVDQYTVSTIGTTSAPTAGQLFLLSIDRDNAHAGDTTTAIFALGGVELEYA